MGYAENKIKRDWASGWERGALGLLVGGGAVRFGYRVGSRMTEPVWREVYKGCKPIFFHFHTKFLSHLFSYQKNTLHSLCHVLPFLWVFRRRGWPEVVAARWATTVGGGAAARTTSFLLFFFTFSTSFLSLYSILNPKIPKEKATTLDLEKGRHEFYLFLSWIATVWIRSWL